MLLFKRLPMNLVGRDLVVGDIHGCYDLLLDALRSVGFNTTRDRLFCVGDTVDRGPDSPRALRFLRQPWVHAVRGNHEDMFLDIYADPEPPSNEVIQFATERNGMSWWMGMPEADRQHLLAEWRALPVALEVDGRRGTVGLVHADVPSGMNWTAFTDAVARGDSGVIHNALWGRHRLQSEDASGVEGVGRIFVGHTPIPAARRLSNIYYVDTGAVFGLLKGPGNGAMTIADMASRTGLFDRKDIQGAIDAIGTDEPSPSTSFGAYASPSP